MKRKLLSTFAAGLVALLAVATVPPPDGFEYVESETDVFFHRSDCTGPDDDLYIDLIASEDLGDGCGTVGGISQIANEASMTADMGPAIADEFPTKSPLGVALDGTRDITGVIAFGQFRVISDAGETPLGAGRTDIEVSFMGQVDGQFVDLGTATGSLLVPPGELDYEVPFTLDISDDIHGEILSDLTVTLVVRGVAVNQDYVAFSGASNFTLPTLDLSELPEEG